MAVPDTSTFTLQDVLDEIYTVSRGKDDPTSLEECFLYADQGRGNFSPIYVGNRDRLSNFRAYVHG